MIYIKDSTGWKEVQVFDRASGQWRAVGQVYLCNAQGVWVPSIQYQWVPGAWGTCSVECGGGTQTRTITCADMQGNTAPDWCCTDPLGNVGPKPATSQACNTNPCKTYLWAIGAWGACSVQCGGGTQTRSVVCEDTTGAVYADSVCVAQVGAKPNTSRVCNTQTCQVPRWQVGPWSECSAPCGGGTQTRTVTCVDQDSGEIIADQICLDDPNAGG